jgi:pimeloyl-ACP methyl ester carboxylesterase
VESIVLQQFAGGAVFGTATGEVGAASVLALHGWARTHRDFDRLLGGVGETSMASVALDLPGFGASPPPPGPWGTLDYADCLLEVIDTMATPLVVLGHSFGGRVALQLAATHP